MTDQEMKKYEIQQRLMAQQGRMSRAVIGQIMSMIDELVDAEVRRSHTKDGDDWLWGCKCKKEGE